MFNNMLNRKNELLQFCSLYEYAYALLKTYEYHGITEEDWKIIYDEIFSKHICHRALELYKFEWYDPDTSYEEDVRAFMGGFFEAYIKVKEILQVMNKSKENG